MSIHSRSIPIRAVAATIDQTILSLGKPKRVLDFVKSCLKHPVERAAVVAQAEVPHVAFTDLFPDPGALNFSVDPSSFSRHGWNVKLHEEVYLAAAVAVMKPRVVFEIGTFDGNTTRRLAEAAPADAVVYTIDLPEEAFNATQSPDAFSGCRVGERYADSPARAKIKQLRADAAKFDFSPYYGLVDFVFVDAAHDYPHGLLDSRTALKLVRPGGTIV